MVCPSPFVICGASRVSVMLVGGEAGWLIGIGCLGCAFSGASFATIEGSSADELGMTAAGIWEVSHGSDPCGNGIAEV
jgi:hypothetical protein